MNNYKLKIIFFTIVFVGFSILFFYNPNVFSSGIKSGLTMCGKTIIPSLFPFMVVAEFITLSGVGSAVGEKLSVLTRVIFNLPGTASCVILMSLIGGFPVGARMTARLREENYITKEQGRRILFFCVNCGPAFAVSAVGSLMLGSKKAGIIIYVSLVLSSLILGFVSRFFGKGENEKQIKTSSDINCGVIVDSVKNSISAMLSICAWVMLFSCVGNCIDLLPLNEKIKAVVFSVFEVTNGCNASVKIFPVFIITAIIGWSGIAVHCQLLEYLQKCEMPYCLFALGRIGNALLSSAICFVLLKIFPCEIDVVSLTSNVNIEPYSVSVPSAVAVIILGIFLIADNDLARNDRI